ncbi:uncharacterized protein SPSC_00065 [Sporisorium scitamineum]|uniref:Chitinase domain-containing protein 1 n=1 Tax=Sporisorium scitamineum TaxID=49012 RepID=A0A0F7SCI3_9BASI|nr:uncharacterized protein SPSC_00065 [Sporisorium scitamineum]CDW98528.1 hypothetical protein [Sporisorium scitamineum]
MAAIPSAASLRWLHYLFAILLALTLTIASTTPSVYETDEYIRIQPELDIATVKVINRTVLAYITPWNGKGPSIVDHFQDKIDMVSPVWYTVLVSPTSISAGDGDETTYVLSGGPPSDAEARWLKSKQEQGLQIVPRFYLDRWQQKDYADLLSNPTNWQRLADIITAEVEKRQYDGVVLESAASHLLFEPIQTLSSSLKPKTLTLVLPPLRTAHSLGSAKLDRVQQSQNAMIVQSIPQLATVVDYFSIMTYDMSSAGGRVSDVSGKDFPKDSPLRGAKRGSLRQAGPNTSAKWIGENVRMIEEAVRAAARAKVEKARKQAEAEAEAGEDEEVERLKDPSNPFAYDDFSAQEVLDEAEVASKDNDVGTLPQEQDELSLIRGKLLMGLPMYTYRYPLFWVDKSTGQGVPVPPPTDPFEAKELHSRSSLLPFLRGPGEPVTTDTLLNILSNNDGVILDTKQDSEGYFDYTETVTSETIKGREGYGVKPGDQVYWRMYVPLPSTTKERLGALDENEKVEAGVSLWELGQANSLLLHAL